MDRTEKILLSKYGVSEKALKIGEEAERECA